MREYFYNKLKKLKSLTGLKYMQTLYAEGKEEAINEWLDEVEKISKQFAFIPEEVQKQVIDHNILNEEKLTGFYPAKVSQWLSTYWARQDAAKRQRMIQEYYKEEEPLNKPEVASKEVAMKYINQIKENVKEIGTTKPKKELRKAIKINQEVVECEHCEAEGCQHCEGYGYIKRIVE